MVALLYSHPALSRMRLARLEMAGARMHVLEAMEQAGITMDVIYGHGMAVKISVALAQEGLEYRDLFAMSREAILRIPGIGIKVIKRIEEQVGMPIW